LAIHRSAISLKRESGARAVAMEPTRAAQAFSSSFFALVSEGAWRLTGRVTPSASWNRVEADHWVGFFPAGIDALVYHLPSTWARVLTAPWEPTGRDGRGMGTPSNRESVAFP
jgi:hypothetical protein